MITIRRLERWRDGRVVSIYTRPASVSQPVQITIRVNCATLTLIGTEIDLLRDALDAMALRNKEAAEA